jgi:hypothetical protein
MIAAACRPRRMPTAMPATSQLVDVDFERIALASVWADARWQPAAVAPVDAGREAGGDPAPRPVDPSGALERWRYAGLALELHPAEAEGYYLNLASPDPKAFVMWRADPERVPPLHIVVVTLSYHQAARMLDGGEQVDAVPLDPALRSRLEPFVAEHYKPEPRRKVRRNDPFAADGPPRGPERGSA